MQLWQITVRLEWLRRGNFLKGMLTHALKTLSLPGTTDYYDKYSGGF